MSTRKSSQNMTQGTLNFGSIKPKRNAMLNAKSKSKQTKVAPALKNSTSVGSFEIDEIVVPPSLEDEDEPIPKIEKTSKDSDVVEDRGRVLRTRKSAKPSVETIAALRPNPAAENREPPKLNENNPTYIAHYAVVQEKMDHMKPIHSEGQSKIHAILRCFDMSYEYGPCVGLTRLERWKMADALGLSPPKEVKDILTTKEGLEKREFSESVLFNQV